MALKVSGEASVVADLREGALDDPSFWHSLETWHVGTLDDLQTSGAGLGHGCRHLRPLIAAVGVDHLDERGTVGGISGTTSAHSGSVRSLG